MLDKIESKTVHKDKEGDQYRKKSKTLNEVKPFKNISKNLHCRDKSRAKEVLPSHKLRDHEYEY